MPQATPGELARLDAMTDEEITRAAEADPDNPPLTEDELARIGAVQLVRRARASTGLSQAQFAERYRINLARLRDWEQGRYALDSVARAYLTVIAADPEGIARVLAEAA
jgi:putative transcriptional regulator